MSHKSSQQFLWIIFIAKTSIFNKGEIREQTIFVSNIISPFQKATSTYTVYFWTSTLCEWPEKEWKNEKWPNISHSKFNIDISVRIILAQLIINFTLKLNRLFPLWPIIYVTSEFHNIHSAYIHIDSTWFKLRNSFYSICLL